MEQAGGNSRLSFYKLNLELILKDVSDPILRENFFRIQRYIQSQVLFQPEFKFIEVDLSQPSYANPVSHGLSFIPKDIIPLSAEGDYNFYFRPDESDKQNVYVANHGPVRLRFLVGNFNQTGRRQLSEKGLPFVAPNGFSNSGGTLPGSGSDGWAFLQDAGRTQTSPLSILPNTRTLLPNDTAGALTNYTNAPANASSWWDAINSSFWPSKSGEFYTFKLNFQFVPLQNNTSVLIESDIGTGNSPYASTRYIQNGAGVVNKFSLPIPFPVGPNAFSNGVKFYFTSQSAGNIFGINLTIIRDFHL